jgi:hypothetical protein
LVIGIVLNSYDNCHILILKRIKDNECSERSPQLIDRWLM